MKLSTLKDKLKTTQTLDFTLPNGEKIPSHFHITEVGYITKHFIDCGGTIREEKVVNLQLWYAHDTEHRLTPNRLLDIVLLSEEKLGISDLEIEVEYQAETIGKYGLSFDNESFVLTGKQTACLAEDACGIPAVKPKLNLADLTVISTGTCSPNSGCC